MLMAARTCENLAGSVLCLLEVRVNNFTRCRGMEQDGQDLGIELSGQGLSTEI